MDEAKPAKLDLPEINKFGVRFGEWLEVAGVDENTRLSSVKKKELIIAWSEGENPLEQGF